MCLDMSESFIANPNDSSSRHGNHHSSGSGSSHQEKEKSPAATRGQSLITNWLRRAVASNPETLFRPLLFFEYQLT
jgi:hypothetical protein